MTTTATPAATAGRTVSLPSARVLLSAVWAVCVLFPIMVYVAEIVFTDKDPYRDNGAVESMLTIGAVGSVALLIVVGAGLILVRTPERAKIGALVFGALSIITLVFFWSGAPGIFGAGAAWMAGLTKGGRPLGGAARMAGIVGAFVAVLNLILSVGGLVLSWVA